jgi:hypothetical protein
MRYKTAKVAGVVVRVQQLSTTPTTKFLRTFEPFRLTCYFITAHLHFAEWVFFYLIVIIEQLLRM